MGAEPHENRALARIIRYLMPFSGCAAVLDRESRLKVDVGFVRVLRLIAHGAARAWPEAPPRGWWIMMRALGMEYRLPLVPAPSRKAPMDAASPKQYVWTSHRHICVRKPELMDLEFLTWRLGHKHELVSGSGYQHIPILSSLRHRRHGHVTAASSIGAPIGSLSKRMLAARSPMECCRRPWSCRAKNRLSVRHLHGVVDAHARRHGAARRVDEQLDVLRAGASRAVTTWPTSDWCLRHRNAGHVLRVTRCAAKTGVSPNVHLVGRLRVEEQELADERIRSEVIHLKPPKRLIMV